MDHLQVCILLLLPASLSGVNIPEDGNIKEPASSIVDPINVPRGVQVRLTQYGLNFVAKIEVAHLKDSIDDMKIPDAKGGGEYYSYSVTNIMIKKLRVDRQSMKTTPGISG